LPWRSLLGLWLLTRLATLLVAAVAAQVGVHQSGWLAPEFGPALDVWHKGDVRIYLDIAARGYTPGYLSNAGWCPGFPLLTRLLSFGPNLMLNGLMATNLALLLALGSCWKVLRLDNSERISWRSLLLLLAFPSAFFFCAPQSESLYLAASAGAFWAARQRRWALAGVLGAVAVSTRIMGLCLVPALLWEWRVQRVQGEASWIQALWLGCIPLAHLAFCWHLWHRVGDWLGYYHQQQRLENYISTWTLLERGRPLQIQHGLGMAFGLISLGLLMWGWRRLRASERIYLVLCLSLPFYHTLFLSQHRLMLVLWPLFRSPAQDLSNRSFAGLVLICALVQVFATTQFALGNPGFLY
jgi:hypothetical protein